MQPRTCIIVNPGSREGEEAERQLREAFAGRPEVVVEVTRHPHHAQELAAAAGEQGFATVVAAGGDGTVNEVVNGLEPYLDRVRLGILPVGTGNDLARTLQLPDTLAGCIGVLEAGSSRRCDLVEVSGGAWRRLLVNVSAGGFSGEVNENLTPELKQSWGPLAYLRAAVETLPERVTYRAILAFDGGGQEIETVLNLVVANGRFVAGGIPVAPYAELDDGVFDVVLVKDCTLAGLAALAPRVLVGKHLENSAEKIVFRQARELTVAAEPPIPFNVDGEMVGEETVTFRVLPGAVAILAPAPPALAV